MKVITKVKKAIQEKLNSKESDNSKALLEIGKNWKHLNNKKLDRLN